MRKKIKKLCFVLFPICSVFFQSSVLLGHERWVEHSVLQPIHENVFHEFSFDMFTVVGRTVLLFLILTVLWKFKKQVQKFFMKGTRKLFPGSLRGRPLDSARGDGFSIETFVKVALQYVYDEVIYSSKMEHYVIPYIQRFAIRVPALVLMYAATLNVLIMPSFPLEDSTAIYFKAAQVILAIMILCELALPIVGWVMLLLFVYLVQNYGIVSVDAFPVLGIAFVYITMPFVVKRSVLFIRENQIRVLKVIIGISFASLGVMKLYNHALIIGVVDHFHNLEEDWFIRFFWFGTNPEYAREWWAFGFAMSEIMTGLLVMFGMFKRIICLVVTLIFTKLMIMDIGWKELPHLYPISIFLLIAFSRIYAPQEPGVVQKRRHYDKVSFKDAKTVWDRIKVAYTIFLSRVN